MPINRLLKDSKLTAEEIERLNQAYAFTDKLGGSERERDWLCPRQPELLY
jgi:hypothetical protein